MNFNRFTQNVCKHFLNVYRKKKTIDPLMFAFFVFENFCQSKRKRKLRFSKLINHILTRFQTPQMFSIQRPFIII